MMSECPEPFVFDVHGVLGWATATGNERAAITADVEIGRVKIFNRVWDEMRTAYPDEAGALQDIQFERDRVTDEHREAAAALAERVQATFPLRGPYDAGIPFWMAGIAQCGPFTIVTDARRKALYQKVDGLAVLTVEEYLALH